MTPTLLPPERIAEIEKRHEAANKNDRHGKSCHEAHLDRAALLSHIRALEEEAKRRQIETPPAPVTRDQWEPIETLPDANDIVWLLRGDSIIGPIDPHTVIHGGFVVNDGCDHWAPCEPPRGLPTPPAQEKQ